jgi:hypothetical protein
MDSTFGLAFSISHFIFLFVQALSLLTVPSRFCHFVMCGRFHIPNGSMDQFPTLCDYIQQRRAQQVETHKKFKKICGYD